MQYDCARLVLTNHLSHKRDARRQLRVLTQLKVLHESDTLNHGVLAVKSAVHVRNRATRNEISFEILVSCLSFRFHGLLLTSDHLEETSTRRTELVESDRGCECAIQRTEDERDDDQDGECPPRHARVTGVVGGHGNSVGTKKHREIPPSRDGLINLHLFVVLD